MDLRRNVYQLYRVMRKVAEKAFVVWFDWSECFHKSKQDVIGSYSSTFLFRLGKQSHSKMRPCRTSSVLRGHWHMLSWSHRCRLMPKSSSNHSSDIPLSNDAVGRPPWPVGFSTRSPSAWPWANSRAPRALPRRSRWSHSSGCRTPWLLTKICGLALVKVEGAPPPTRGPWTRLGVGDGGLRARGRDWGPVKHDSPCSCCHPGRGVDPSDHLLWRRLTPSSVCCSFVSSETQTAFLRAEWIDIATVHHPVQE